MFYAKFEQGVGFSASTEQQAGMFPVITAKPFPVFEILVFDSENNQWIEDAALEATYNTAKAKADAVAMRLRKQNFGSEFMAKVIELNVAKFAVGQLTQQNLVDMDLDVILQSIERAAWRGNLTTLKGLIQSYSGPYYTSQEKTDLVALIDASGLI